MPIFPLDTVLLPGAPLPLHIFEPRYRALVAGRLARPTTARPSWPASGSCRSTSAVGGEVRGPGRHHRRDPDDGADVPARFTRTDELPDELAAVGTFASIVEVERYEDGRSDLLTVGGRRFRLLELEPTDKPYLQARVDWLPEAPGVVSPDLAEAARTRCTRYLAELRETRRPRAAGGDLRRRTRSRCPIRWRAECGWPAASARRCSRRRRPPNGCGWRSACYGARSSCSTRTRSVPVSPGLLQLQSRPT